eukprot:2428659-Amphidinium_carterae.2
MQRDLNQKVSTRLQESTLRSRCSKTTLNCDIGPLLDMFCQAAMELRNKYQSTMSKLAILDAQAGHAGDWSWCSAHPFYQEPTTSLFNRLRYQKRRRHYSPFIDSK